MREILKLGAYLFLADEANQSNLVLDSLMYGAKINSYLPIKSQRSKSPLDVSTKSKKSSLSKQLFNAIQTQLAKGHNCANFRTLFLQACQNLAVYGAVFFEGVVRIVCLFVCLKGSRIGSLKIQQNSPEKCQISALFRTQKFTDEHFFGRDHFG